MADDTESRRPPRSSASNTFTVPPGLSSDEDDGLEERESLSGDPMDALDAAEPPLTAGRFAVPQEEPADTPQPSPLEKLRGLVRDRLPWPRTEQEDGASSPEQSQSPSEAGPVPCGTGVRRRVGACLQPTMVVLTGFLISLTIASKIRFYPVLHLKLLAAPVVQKTHATDTNNLRWIGELYATISLVFVPLATGLIQLCELNYRFVVFVGGALHLLGCLTSSGVYNPEYLLISDAFLNGVSSAILLSVVILVMDDVFPDGSPYRILATSLCQGSLIGAFFICDLFSMVLLRFGWRYTYMMLGGLVLCESLLAAFFFPTIGVVCCTAFDPANPDEVLLPSRQDDRSIPWRRRLLGLTTRDIARCPSLLAWLFERMLVEIITNGVFLLLLKTTGMATDPSIPIIYGRKRMEMLSAFFYSGGQSATYIVGASFGGWIKGFLIHTYTASAVGLMISLLIWQTIRIYLNSIDTIVANVIFAFLSGACLGMLQTFAYAASEEATRVPARKAYPITKMMCGLANVIGPLLFHALSHVSSVNVWLGCFSVMAGFDAIILVFILHKLHVTRPRIFKTVR